MKHTKGPWITDIQGASAYVRGQPRTFEKGEMIAKTWGAANAQLISAAPEMLDALEKIEKTLLEKHQGIENHTYELMLICDVIRKAKGS